ncbi:MAG: hypothetical protein K9H26_19475 [Prolixibacteraceae bacterium]|nr:hypothetical protein [Prolixibacteraceae bacterium]
MKKLELEQLENINGGNASTACGVLMGGWSFMMGLALSAAPLTFGASAAAGLVVTGISVGVCALVATK